MLCLVIYERGDGGYFSCGGLKIIDSTYLMLLPWRAEMVHNSFSTGPSPKNEIVNKLNDYMLQTVQKFILVLIVLAR